jgi:hypothetical protein
MSMPLPRLDPVQERRIKSIKGSLRCFLFSLVGLVPLLGLPFAVSAMIQGWQLDRSIKSEWNAGARYLGAGRRIAPVGLVSTVVFLVFVCFVVPAILKDIWVSHSGST